MDSKLAVIETTAESAAQKPTSSLREEKIARLERLWRLDPEQFDPQRNAIERLRCQRTLDLMDRHLHYTEKTAVDLGCAGGYFSRQLHLRGCKVTAVDAASQALQRFREPGSSGIELVQDCLPQTRLQDSAYSIVFCTDTMAYLKPMEYRLFFSELARLAGNDGHIVASTPFDIHTSNGPDQYRNIAETELVFIDLKYSYHRLTLSWIGFLEAPKKYCQGALDPGIRKQQLEERSGFSRGWYRLNSTKWALPIWQAVSWIASPLARLLQQSESAVTFFERISRFIWGEDAISHVIFVGKRRPLILPPPPEEIPREFKTKRSVWE